MAPGKEKNGGGQIILDLYKVKRLTANSYMLNIVKADPTDTPPIPKDQKSREYFSDTESSTEAKDYIKLRKKLEKKT